MGPNLPPSTVDGLTLLADIAAAVGGRHEKILAEIKATAIAARQDLDDANAARAHIKEQEQWIASQIANINEQQAAASAQRDVWVAEHNVNMAALVETEAHLKDRENEINRRLSTLASAEKQVDELSKHLASKAAGLEEWKAALARDRQELDDRLARIKAAVE